MIKAPRNNQLYIRSYTGPVSVSISTFLKIAWPQVARLLA